MDARMLAIFQREVARQARFALRAGAEIDAAAEQLDDLPVAAGFMQALREANDRLWSNAQLLLTAVANISKLLWGKGEGQATGRADLRASLGVGEDDSPLRSRQARNDVFEHFDEELLKWARKWGPEAVLLDATSGSVRQIGGGADPVARAPEGEPGYQEHHLRYTTEAVVASFYAERCTTSTKSSRPCAKSVHALKLRALTRIIEARPLQPPKPRPHL
jgi:hypothetical protein